MTLTYWVILGFIGKIAVLEATQVCFDPDDPGMPIVTVTPSTPSNNATVTSSTMTTFKVTSSTTSSTTTTTTARPTTSMSSSTTVVVTTTIKSVPELPWTCSFESEDSPWCGMSHIAEKDLDWRRYRGWTSTWYTGPEEAEDGKYYVYVESTSFGNRWPGDRTRLMTPWLMLPDENEVCVRFSYHMWGRTMGNLYMWLENPTDDARDCMWAKRGATDTNTWKTTNESCEVKSSTFRVVFEAMKGNGAYSDIAVDDIRISPGDCN